MWITKQIIILITVIIICINCISIDMHQKVIVYYDSWVTRFISECCKSINGIILGHKIFIRQDRWHADISFVLEHELIHVKQIERYFVLGFYTMYLIGSIWYGYTDHPFEVEARTEAIRVDLSDFTYLIFD